VSCHVRSSHLHSMRQLLGPRSAASEWAAGTFTPWRFVQICVFWYALQLIW
jgi:hypothetical protein